MRCNRSRLTGKGEQTPDHVTCDTAGEITRVQRAAREIRRLAELVAPGEGEGVRDGEGKGDACDLQRPDVSTEERKGKVKREKERALTNERQPDEVEASDGQDGEGGPQDGLRVHGEPEEAGIGGVDDLGAGLAALEDPLAVAGRGVDLVPPPQAHEAAAGDVLEVVEVGGQQEDGDDEDEHHAFREEEEAEEVHEEGGCGFVLRVGIN